MPPVDAWLWCDFLCEDESARDHLLAEVTGTGSTGSEELPAEGGTRVRVFWPLAGGPGAAAAGALAAVPGVRALGQGRVEREDWLAVWRRHFAPLQVSVRLWVCPPWDVPKLGPEAEVLVIDPQMAFGTGEHPTTQMCLQLLEEVLRPGDDVLDVGTGSGILAIAAAKLGARRVYAVEQDADAVRNARDNVMRNAVTDCVRVVEGSFRDQAIGTARCVVCNLILAKLLPLVPRLARAAAGGRLILSGVASEHRDELRDALRAAGCTPATERRREGWFACVSLGPSRQAEPVQGGG